MVAIIFMRNAQKYFVHSLSCHNCQEFCLILKTESELVNVTWKYRFLQISSVKIILRHRNCLYLVWAKSFKRGSFAGKLMCWLLLELLIYVPHCMNCVVNIFLFQHILPRLVIYFEGNSFNFCKFPIKCMEKDVSIFVILIVSKNCFYFKYFLRDQVILLL